MSQSRPVRLPEDKIKVSLEKRRAIVRPFQSEEETTFLLPFGRGVSKRPVSPFRRPGQEPPQPIASINPFCTTLVDDSFLRIVLLEEHLTILDKAKNLLWEVPYILFQKFNEYKRIVFHNNFSLFKGTGFFLIRKKHKRSYLQLDTDEFYFLYDKLIEYKIVDH